MSHWFALWPLPLCLLCVLGWLTVAAWRDVQRMHHKERMERIRRSDTLFHRHDHPWPEDGEGR